MSVFAHKLWIGWFANEKSSFQSQLFRQSGLLASKCTRSQKWKNVDFNSRQTGTKTRKITGTQLTYNLNLQYRVCF